MARGKGGLGRGLDSLFEDAAPVFESEHAAVETPPRALSPTQRSRPCPCVRSSRTPTSPARPLSRRPSANWLPASPSTAYYSPSRCVQDPWAATASWQASAAGAPPAWRVLPRFRWSSRMCPMSRPWSWRWWRIYSARIWTRWKKLPASGS